MSAEATFISAIRPLAGNAAARDLLDDAAVFDIGGRSLVLTKDMLVEGVHYLPGDPPGDVACKLLAVNLSDLAAKGARPVGVLLGYMLGEAAWDRAFVVGLQSALNAFDIALLGGDTVRGPEGAARVLSLTAIGEATGVVPSRAGARAGDDLWVSGTIGDAGAGLAIRRGELRGDDALVRRYRRPEPRLEAGPALAPLVTAMLDVSDGLLIDASRMGEASGLGVQIDLDAVPLSPSYVYALGANRSARLRAATAGDDYELLFTVPPDTAPAILALSERLGLPLTRIGRTAPAAGLRLLDHGAPVPLPDRLGYEHGTD